MEDPVEILAQAYSKCETKGEAVGVSHVVEEVRKEIGMSRMESGYFIHQIFERLLEIGYNEDVFPVNAKEFYKSLKEEE